MIVYDGVKSDFMSSVENDTIAMEIRNNILQKMGRHTPENEFNSWENSLLHMYKVVNDSEIPTDAGIAIEYNIPLTSKRVDFIISGADIQNNDHIVIVELKQWERAEVVDDDMHYCVRTFVANDNRIVCHPSY